MKAAALCIAIFLLPHPARAQAPRAVSVLSEAPYSPQGAQVLIVRSGRLSRDFVVVIHPPGAAIVPGSTSPAKAAKLPAIYALDGGYDVAGPMAQVMATAGAAAPAYTVSISYPPGQSHRNTDLLHSRVTEGAETYGGGGAAFQTFLTDDLRPFLEARYPLDPARAVLFGHSFGGVFAANVLASRPTAFSGYIIASASAWRDPELLARLARAAPAGDARRVFVAAGGNEPRRMLDATRDIAAALSAGGSTLKVQIRIFEGENHLSYYPLATYAGLNWVLPSPAAQRVAITIPPERLQRFVGVYAYPDGRKVTIERRGGALFAAVTDIPGETELLAESPTRFFMPGGFDVVMTFEGAEPAPATAIDIRIGGAESRAMRLED